VKRPSWLKSLAFKLGLVLFLVVAGAMAIVYFAVVPRLESRLVDNALDGLRRSRPLISNVMQQNDPVLYQGLAETFQAQLNARVVIFAPLTTDSLVVIADSSGQQSDDLQRDPLALQVIQTGEPVYSRTERGGEEFAELAAPAPGGTILLLSAPLADRLSAYEVVRRDVLIAGGIALAACMAVGTLAALKLTRRIRRLEAAAERIADGDFAAQIADRSEDEVGQLARTFDRMRVRLADVDRARREFIANASHELRTPLFALGGFLELLVDEELDERTRRDFLESSRVQVERLTRLATDLLDLSRLDAGEIGLESEAVDLSAAATALAEEFGPLAETSGHTLSVTSAGDVFALGDEERVLQIGRSLVENALRHTPRGTAVELRATVWVDRAELAVHDNGLGISAEEQKRVFERFYRAEGGAAFGSGIGLAIARELAHRMGGTLELRSQPSATTFTLALPRSPTPAAFSRENALVR
jgi:signal transduction histidine kinase